MAFCVKCGKELVDGANFCAWCGASTKPTADASKRTTVYEGDIHKCPNCGANVESFSYNCPACGFEFRDVKATSSVKELADKLEQIQNRNSLFGSSPLNLGKLTQQASLVNNFAIPNTKEDIMEFLILSSANINSNFGNILEKAWKSKADQAYEKAKLLFGQTSEFKNIQSIHDKTAKGKKKKWFAFIVYIVVCVIIILLSYISMWLSANYSEDGIKDHIEYENKRLYSITDEIYECIDSGKYALARTKAGTLEFKYTSNRTDDDEKAKEQWDETREEILKLIDEAEQKSKGE